MGQPFNARRIAIRPFNWKKARQIKRHQTARRSEEILPVRHYDWIAHFGRRTPEKPAVVDLASGRRLTYAQFDARISRLAAHLRDRLEVGRGDRVAVLALNTSDTLEVQFACGRLGAIFLPLVAGYRHTFNGAGTGFYVEPFAGYTFGATDIQKTDAGGNPLFSADGSEIDEKFNGATAGLSIGYIIPSASYPINFGLRYEHIFVSGTSPSLVSFRISWSVLTGRRLQQQ